MTASKALQAASPAMTAAKSRQRRLLVTYETRFGRGLLEWRDGILVAHRLPGRQQRGLQAETAFSTEHPPAARNLATQLEAYFSGRPANFDPMNIPIDLSSWSSFEIALAEALAAVPHGSCVSYGQLAALAGYTGAHRAAGNFLAKNPFPVILPCHRVILASGRVGNFSAGAYWKRRLLELEGSVI